MKGGLSLFSLFSHICRKRSTGVGCGLALVAVTRDEGSTAVVVVRKKD